jgi:hypothetical protein
MVSFEPRHGTLCIKIPKSFVSVPVVTRKIRKRKNLTLGKQYEASFTGFPFTMIKHFATFNINKKPKEACASQSVTS